ncbi:MAG TPA: hypothetical protein DCE41_08560, partial [Cytophagales bacterium]|nr:hypothetical protein [Cytophagales bacterium]
VGLVVWPVQLKALKLWHYLAAGVGLTYAPIWISFLTKRSTGLPEALEAVLNKIKEMEVPEKEKEAMRLALIQRVVNEINVDPSNVYYELIKKAKS